ncbi:MAG: protein kinase [Myxococcota bacterium]
MRSQRPRQLTPVGTILEPGTIVADRFEVGTLVDSGGMGSVYQATDRKDGERSVALKVIRGGLAPNYESGTSLDTQQLLDSFQREAELLANLRHPSIVKYVCHGRTRTGEPYLAMEWVEGEDLKTKLRRGPLSIQDTLRLGSRLAEGLGAAHRVGVVHRDIKPSNILLPDGDVGQAKIADFGIAQFTQYVVVPGGTPGYMAPELHLERAQIDARADVYSLGLMLSRCLSPDSKAMAQAGDELETATVIEGKGQAVDSSAMGLSVPAELDELLARMLSTDRTQRPMHGGVVASALQAVALRVDSGGSSVLSAKEQQLVAVIRVRFDEDSNPDQESITDVLSRFGAQLRAFDERGLVIMLEGRVSEGDHTLRAALCALEVRRVCPNADLALVLGQMPPQTERTLVAAAGRLLLAADREAKDQQAPDPTPRDRPILIDPRSANLFDVRFDIERGRRLCRLLRARRELAGGRLLLGRPSPWLGRGPQVERMLLEYLDAVAVREPRAVLLQAEAGMGKSRLAQEFVSGLETGANSPQVWVARGDPVSAGSPFALLTQVINDMAGIVTGESEKVRRDKLHRCLSEYFSGPQLARVEAFIGEICRTPYHSDFCLPLLVARQDPQFMAEQTRKAWEDLVAAVSTHRPLVIVLDDCQWGDLASMRYCDNVLRSRSSQALMLVALARPGATIWSSPETSSRFVRVELRRLSDEVCAAFLREVLGEQVNPGLVKRLTRRSGGNPLHLEELARAVGQSGSEHVEDTIAAMMQSRLLSLGFDARQILRAASVFGQVFWLEGVVALRREGSSAALVREWLDELIAQELVVRRSSSRFPGQEEYEFHHLSMQEAAYGMLTTDDRRAAHRTVAHWLGAHGESNSYILAEHHRLGGDAEAAARCYCEAARQAFARNEFEAVLEITEQGLGCAARGEDRGNLVLLRAQVEALSGRHAEASDSAFEAMDELPETSPSWLAAAGEASLASARAGYHERVLEVITRIDDIDPVLMGGGVELLGLIAAAVPLAAAGHGEMSVALLDSVERALYSVAERNPDARGPFHSARGLRGICTGELATALYEMETAAREFESAGSLTNAWGHQAGAGFLYLELGMLARGEELLMEIIRITEGVGLAHTNAVAKHNLGRRIAEAGRIEEGRALEQSALEAFEAHDNRRMMGLTHSFIARIAMGDGNLIEAGKHARKGVRLLDKESGSKIIALATLAQVLLRLDRNDEALTVARQAYEQLHKLDLVQEGESLTRLAYAEALWGAGRIEEALASIQEAKEDLLARADTLGADDARQSFLDRVPENVAILRHAKDWAEQTR